MEQISSDATDTKIEMPSPLQWRNLNVSSRLMERKLLDNVSGEIKHNHFCAIMGPSGSGKSTLLNALACRLDRNIDSQGELLLFGKKYSLSDIKQRGGYVMQDDLLNEFLTVEETLLFTANLRMKPNTSPEAQQERVDEVIRLLGLESCRKVVIGGATRKGISGGERKRVSIGIELLPFPQLLFLDEPTSGLDSVSSLALCRILRSLAHQECAIIATIHQPQFRIFELFDDLILLKSAGPQRKRQSIGLLPACPCLQAPTWRTTFSTPSHRSSTTRKPRSKPRTRSSCGRSMSKSQPRTP